MGLVEWWPQLKVRGGEVALEESLLGFQTYTQPGLPPTPIAAPRTGSIAAVATAPLDEGYLFFVAGCPDGVRDGSHYFARTLDEHNANIAQAQHGVRRPVTIRASRRSARSSTSASSTPCSSARTANKRYFSGFRLAMRREPTSAGPARCSSPATPSSILADSRYTEQATHEAPGWTLVHTTGSMDADLPPMLLEHGVESLGMEAAVVPARRLVRAGRGRAGRRAPRHGRRARSAAADQDGR